MLKSIDYTKTNRYFYARITLEAASTIAFIIAAIAAIYIGCTFYAMEIGIVVFIITFGAVSSFLIYLESHDKPKYEDILEMLKGAKKDVLKQAVRELGVDVESVSMVKPIVLQGKVYDDCFGNFAYKEKDGMPSNYNFAIILFSETQLYYYDYTFSLINANEYDTNTGEYFYRDIISVNTKSEKASFFFENKKYTRNYTKFWIATSGGTGLEVSINREQEKKVQGMRQLLREKKNAMA